MSERRIPLVHRTADPTTSSDPAVQSLLAGLALLDYAPQPRPEFRAELRAQLVAITPRIVAEEAEAAAPAVATGAASASTETVRARRHRHPVRWGRPVGVAASVVALLALVLGGAVWMSQKSLPGGALYGLKRASEDVRLSLTSGDTDRGHAYLAQATTRVQEARDLAQAPSSLGVAAPHGRSRVFSAAGLSARTTSLITAALRSADSDTKQGATLLGDQAVRSKSASPLRIMTGWAPSQLSALSDLAGALPSGPLKTRAQSTWTLTDDALSRARTLSPHVGCTCAASSGRDDLGPVPCAQCPSTAVPHPVAPAPSGTPSTPAGTRHSASSGAQPRRGSTRHGATNRGSTTTKPSGSGRASSSAPASSGGLPTLPNLPKAPAVPDRVPSKPVSVNSCGVSVSAGPLGVDVGSCSGH